MRRSRSRQGVAQVEEAHVDMGVRGRADGRKPRIPLEIGVLEHQVESAPFGVLRKSGIGAEVISWMARFWPSLEIGP